MTRPPVAALLLTAALAARAGAQTAPNPDSLPARGGTWAAEAGLGTNTFFGNVASVGALRFVGARSAVTFNLFGAHRSQTSDETSGFGGGTSRSTAVGATLGGRWYGRARRALAGFGGTGLTAGYSRYTSGSGQGQTGTRAGGYAELGAAYLIAGRLAVNAATGLTVARLGGQSEGVVYESPDDSGTRVVTPVRGWDAEVGGVRLSATLFF